MSDHGYTFHVLDPDVHYMEQAFEVFAYPMGDITVRRKPDAEPVDGTAQVMAVHRSAVDWTLVAEWAVLSEKISPAARRVLVLPYLPSARGDKDTPSPAVINATLAAGTGITDMITIDPHSPVWLTALRAANPNIAVHELPLPGIVAHALTADSSVRHRGVISPDKGAVHRAGDVAALLGLPLYVANKNRDPKTGHLTNYSFDAALEPGAYLVVDDIFDGGGTFALLTGAVPDTVTLDLWVTHVGFTKPNFSADARAPYRGIYTTNSLWSAVAAVLQDSHIQVSDLRPWIVEAVTNLAQQHTRLAAAAQKR